MRSSPASGFALALALAASWGGAATAVAQEGDCTENCDVHEPEPPGPIFVQAQGGPYFRDATSLKLRELRVLINLDAFSKGVPEQRRTQWVVQNDGPGREVEFGFEYRWREPRDAGQLKPLGARVVPVGDVGVEHGQWLDCRTLVDLEWVGPTGDVARGWCRDTRWVATGRSELNFTINSDGEPYWHSGLGAVRYDFAAERAARAAPERVTITIAPSSNWRHTLAPITPAGATVQDGRLTWRLERPDLAVLHLLATWDNSRESRGPVGARGGGLSASASSSLARQGRFRFDPALALDGDDSTAWCEGAPGDGTGEWLEVRSNLDPASAKGCRLKSFILVGGLAHSREAWRRNGRLKRYRISRCDEPAIGFEGNLPLLDQPPGMVGPRPEVAVPGGATPLLRATDGCWRLTLLEVLPGKDPDACIGEFIPVLQCGP